MRHIPSQPWWQGAVLALLAGLSLALSFPGPALWPLALVAPALLVTALRGRRSGAAFALSSIAGAAFYGVLVSWSSRFLGPIPWLALTAVMTLSFALGGVCLAALTRGIPARWPGLRGEFVIEPIALTLVWMLREIVANRFPYGGFAWGRIAQSQSNGPLLDLVAWLGVDGLGAFMVWCSLMALALIRRGTELRDIPNVLRAHASHRTRQVALGFGMLVCLALVVPPLPQSADGSVRIAAVQGNTPEAGYFTPGAPGAVLAKHLEVTRATVPASWAPQLILWPEGSVDRGPQYHLQSARAMSALSAEYANAPILANTVTVTGEGTGSEAYLNTQFAWTAQGGWGTETSKKRPVPFGEYIPDRDFYYALAPDLIGMVGRGYSPGTDPVTVDLAGARAGVLICFDVIEDRVVREAVAEDAEFLLLPTNNADFDRSDEAAQQLAFARIRAVETGRWVIQSSTVGWSAAFDGSGDTVQALEWFTDGAMLLEVPRAHGTTPAMLCGEGISRALALGGLVTLIACWPRRAAPREKRQEAKRAAAPKMQ